VGDFAIKGRKATSLLMDLWWWLEQRFSKLRDLIIGMDGALEHFIDFQSEKINTPCVSFITRGKVHRVIPQVKNGKCDIWVLRFKSEFTQIGCRITFSKG
jgi:hypothetical protein